LLIFMTSFLNRLSFLLQLHLWQYTQTYEAYRQQITLFYEIHFNVKAAVGFSFVLLHILFNSLFVSHKTVLLLPFFSSVFIVPSYELIDSTLVC
jgi:hypothetical protein